jgi:hypothetical protein
VEPIPAAHAYGAYMAWLAMYASDAELAGALLVNFAAWGANCGRMSRALRAAWVIAALGMCFANTLSGAGFWGKQAAVQRPASSALAGEAVNLIRAMLGNPLAAH